MNTIITRSFMPLLLLVSMLLSPALIAAEVVNINKADAAAISQNLAGIGPIKADAIVRYRNSKGRFSSLDDLQNVTGIGPALIKKNKRYLSLSKGLVKGDAKQYQAAKKAASGKKSTKSKTKSTKSKQSSSSSSKTKASNSKSSKKTGQSKSSKKKSGGTASSAASKKPSKSDKSSKSGGKTGKKKKAKTKKKVVSDT